MKDYYNIKPKKDAVSKLVLEKKLGRKLKSNEDIHYVDGNKTNARMNNLMVVKKGKLKMQWRKHG